VFTRLTAETVLNHTKPLHVLKPRLINSYSNNYNTDISSEHRAHISQSRFFAAEFPTEIVRTFLVSRIGVNIIPFDFIALIMLACLFLLSASDSINCS
jgi:hypothetical protein